MNAVDNVIQVQRDMEYDHSLWNTVNNEYRCIDWALKALGLCLFRRIENDNRIDQWRILSRYISVDFIRLLPVKKRTVESKKKKQQVKRHKFRELEDWIEEHAPFKNDIGC